MGQIVNIDFELSPLGGRMEVKTITFPFKKKATMLYKVLLKQFETKYNPKYQIFNILIEIKLNLIHHV